MLPCGGVARPARRHRRRRDICVRRLNSGRSWTVIEAASGAGIIRDRDGPVWPNGTVSQFRRVTARHRPAASGKRLRGGAHLRDRQIPPHRVVADDVGCVPGLDCQRRDCFRSVVGRVVRNHVGAGPPHDALESLRGRDGVKRFPRSRKLNIVPPQRAATCRRPPSSQEPASRSSRPWSGRDITSASCRRA